MSFYENTLKYEDVYFVSEKSEAKREFFREASAPSPKVEAEKCLFY